MALTSAGRADRGSIDMDRFGVEVRADGGDGRDYACICETECRPSPAM